MTSPFPLKFKICLGLQELSCLCDCRFKPVHSNPREEKSMRIPTAASVQCLVDMELKSNHFMNTLCDLVIEMECIIILGYWVVYYTPILL